MIYLDIDLPPKAAPRPRAQPKGGKSYLPADYMRWKQAVVLLARNQAAIQQVEPFEGPLAVTLSFDARRIQVRLERLGHSHRFGQADLDNLVKAVLDALQDAGLIPNDRKVELLIAGFAGAVTDHLA